MPRRLSRRAFLALGALALGAAGGLAGIAGAALSRERPGDQRIALATLTLAITSDPWRLALIGPDGQTLWEEAPESTIGYRTVDGQSHRARRLGSVNVVSADLVQLVAETDDPNGGAISIEVRALQPGVLRISVNPDA